MRELQAQIIAELGVAPRIDPETEAARRVDFLCDYLRATHTRGFVLGISGGVDSTLAGRLAQLAVEKLREDEIPRLIADYERAARNAVAAGFELLNTALLLRGEGVSPGTAIDAASPGDATVQSPQSGAAEHDDAPETSVDPVHDTSLASEIALAAAYRMVATSHAPESRLIKLLEILDHSVFHAAAIASRPRDASRSRTRYSTALTSWRVSASMAPSSAIFWAPKSSRTPRR